MLKNNQFKSLFKKRSADSHKGDYGKSFIVAGSEGMLGAAILCSRGAIRAGAGLVYLAVPAKLSAWVNIATPEIIVVPLNSDKSFLSQIIKANSIAIGPGLGKGKGKTIPLLKALNKLKFAGTIVLDADGLNAFENKTNLLKKYNLKLILTPHPGEMARLLGKTVVEIQNNREAFAIACAKMSNAIVVLKGHRTVVANPIGKIYINNTGNPGMATAGVGDVLTGIISGLCAQGIEAWTAATAGVYLHGLAGDLAAKEKGEYGMIATDLVEKLPYVIQKIS
jgi:NAD(P)H-hydrate epimerase